MLSFFGRGYLGIPLDTSSDEGRSYVLHNPGGGWQQDPLAGNLAITAWWGPDVSYGPGAPALPQSPFLGHAELDAVGRHAHDP